MKTFFKDVWYENQLFVYIISSITLMLINSTKHNENDVYLSRLLCIILNVIISL